MISDILRAKTGPLTRELLRHPGLFGLGQVPNSRVPDAVTSMVCGYCSTGCGLNIHLKNGEAVNLTPQTDYPVNLGMACPKGWESLAVLDAPDRARTPLLRNATGNLEPVDWHQAMSEFVSRIKSIQAEHGEDSVAFLSTGQMVTEEMAFLGALAKFGMGIVHGDGNTRQCMATTVVAYKQAFGFDAPPFTYADFEESDVIVLVGSNLCIAHPIMWERVMRNPHRPEIIVVDPRMTETAMNATQHLPVLPKSDMTLFYGISNLLIKRGWIDHEYITQHVNGFDAYAQFVAEFTMERTSQKTGLTPEQIERFAQTIHSGKRVSFWWTMGVNHSHQGVRTAQGLINLALITGNIGRPGTGANSITGQCNAMGSRLFSNTTNLLGGHDFANSEHRAKIAGILKIDESRIPSQSSLPYHKILDEIENGKIRGLWIVCTNTAHSWIDQNRAREVLKRLDFLVVQDIYDSTETARMADLVLPAAGWAEKEGTFINSERRIGLVKKVRRAPGVALSDFNIFRLVAEYWGCSEMFTGWNSPEAVFQLLKQCSQDMPCDITGVRDYQHLDSAMGIQWPYSVRELDPPVTERRLFENGDFYTKSGKAELLFEEPRPLAEPVDEEFPFLLNTGRGSASQWHTQTRTGKSAVLKKLYPQHAFVEINPDDARSLGIKPNGTVVVRSRRGHMQAAALLTHNVAPGQIFIPIHYEGTNQLTDAIFDPYSHQPAYKACAVQIIPVMTFT